MAFTKEDIFGFKIKIEYLFKIKVFHATADINLYLVCYIFGQVRYPLFVRELQKVLSAVF
jgi:hypothetical protein